MAAASRARPSGVMPPLRFFVGALAFRDAFEEPPVFPFAFAQRARWAAAIFARAWADILRRLRGPERGAAATAVEPALSVRSKDANSPSSLSICSAIWTAR